MVGVALAKVGEAVAEGVAARRREGGDRSLQERQRAGGEEEKRQNCALSEK